MKYICLIYHDPANFTRITDQELSGSMGECMDYIGVLARAGHHVQSNGLQSVQSATTLRLRDGKVSMTDGPFSETKEVLGGFTILEARDLNEALQLASKMPALKHASIEVRPIMTHDAAVVGDADRRIQSCLQRAIEASSADGVAATR
jgi:hypothetical protein